MTERHVRQELPDGLGGRCDTGDVTRRVLLVEDDPRVRRVLRLALEDEGYHVSEAATGEQGLAALPRDEPDVVLLDVMLPDTDGFSVCREIRHRSNVPVIMVTARSDSHDVVAGLEAGADDYVTKPLVAKELSARIRALLRRVEPARDHRPRRPVMGDLSIGLDDGVVLRDGEPVGADPHRVPAAGRAGRGRGSHPQPRGPARQGLGLRLLRRLAGSSTCTSAGCGPRSSATRPVRATW